MVIWRSRTPKPWQLRNDLARITINILLLFLFLISGWRGALRASDYFQQYVNFQIDVELLPELHRLEGKQKLLYVNHSHDTLNVLYFHLYLNKFRSSSYAYPHTRQDRGYIEILTLRDALGHDLPFSIDNTILRLPLSTRPLLPGDSLLLNFEFVSVLPPARSRFGYSGDHYDVGNWYPVPAVYDRFGWHADQHLDGEFYQEWGDYQVNITVPKDFVVCATGELLNPEVLPDSVEFPDRRIGYYDFQFIDTTRVTYRFVARQVHDFAWAADPEFVLIRREVEHITLNFLVLNYGLETWQEIFDTAVEALRFFQEKIGPYPYSQLTIVDGFVTAGGIEYPNIVFINDLIANTRQLAVTIIHEIGHQWFYGLLANNQTRFGWMDEGFTSFYEIWCTEHIWGRYGNLNTPRQTFWQKLFGYERNARQQVLLNYLEYSLTGEEEPINTHFDYFQHNPYIPYYDKMSVVLFAGKEMLGDSLFTVAIKHFYQKWKFRHPYPEDLFLSFEEATGMELDWFWDQWLQTTWKCDYRVKKVRGTWKTDIHGRYYQAYIHLQRLQPIAMPLKLRVKLKNGQVLAYEIPVAESRREGQPGKVLPAWHGTHTEHLVELKLPDKIACVQLEPSLNFLDINSFNDDSRLVPSIHWYWMRRQYLAPLREGYTTTIFPFVFFNTIDGFKLGIRTVGNYIYPLYQHTAEVLFSTKRGLPRGYLEWESPISITSSRFMYRFSVHYLDGRMGGEVAFFHPAQHRGRTLHWELGWSFQRLIDRDYLQAPWSDGRVSGLYFNIQKEKRSRAGPIYRARLWGMSSTFFSDFQFHQIRLLFNSYFNISTSRKLELALQAGWSSGRVPQQHLFYLSQASPAEQFTHLYARARGSIPEKWVRNGHFMVPGGGDIRSSLSTPVRVNPSGRNLLAGGLRLDVVNPFHLFPFDVPILTFTEWSLFTQWAEVWQYEFQLDRLAGEAGLSIEYNRLPIWLRYFHLAAIQLDFPLWLNKATSPEQVFQFRWNIRLQLETFL